VLVVDDGGENRELLALVLTRQGCLVDEAENGQVALDLLAAGSYDLVLMDLEMPVMDGFAATRALRRRGHTVPVVALTAHASDAFWQQALQAGCTACLAKPVDMALLLQQMAQLLGGAPQQPAVPAMASGHCAIHEPSLLPEPAIRSRYAGNAMLVPIVRKFAARLAQQLQLARSALQTADLPEVARLAHWLAGSAGTVGYDAFVAPARELEAAARSGDGAGAAALLQRVLRMAEQVELPDLAPN
jgi:CheY-like chemotaxis protein/HPt (histidine-containing phosphotransfer) domain-containing protein